MKWKTHIERVPKKGSIQIIKKFAFLPKKLNDGYTVWLELYTQKWQLNMVEHRYIHGYNRLIDIGPGLKWQIVKEY